MAEFFEFIDGVSLPDVQNGYFLHRLELVVDAASGEEPDQVSGATDAPILVVGSTGGGGRFALNKQSGHVLLLGGGFLKERTFFAEEGNVSKVANTWSEFLERLFCDVEAFVEDRPGYKYMA